jgi:DNA-binding MarR family transcriptional regulator
LSDELVDALQRIVFGGVAMTLTAIMHATGGQELTFSQWRAILVVGETDDGCRVGEVARRVMGALPATSRLLRRLELRGFMTLERDEMDRRATRARLTPEGRRVRNAVLEYRRLQLAAIVDRVKPPPSAHAVLHALAAEFETRPG